MMLVNLWMLKSKNGMYWYARDYVERVGEPCTFLVRKGEKQGIAEDLSQSGFDVIEAGLFGFLHLAIRAMLHRTFVYTPTPHPIPFLRDQLIVLHDDYPFQGPLGRLKRALFWFGTLTSACEIAYISRRVCLPFLSQLSVRKDRTLFAPNIPPIARARVQRPRQQGIVRLAVVGTDSRKKRYELLLAQGLPKNVRLFVYGEQNAYIEELQARFGTDSFVLVSPDAESFLSFIAAADAIVSVAQDEGFGRPLAVAITMGVPCHLLESPAFLEFFKGSAFLYPTLNTLLAGVVRGDLVGPADRSQGFLSYEYKLSIDTAVESIRKMNRVRASAI